MARRREGIGWGRGPTEAEAEAADQRGTEQVVEPYDFDTPPVETVLQAEVGPDEAIPVRLTNPVNVNQLPTHVGGLFSRLLPADVPGSPAAVKVLNKDPKRARLTITSPVVVVAIGRTQAEANDPDAFRLDTNQGPFPFHFTEEVWARSTGAATRISICVEQWAR